MFQKSIRRLVPNDKQNRGRSYQWTIPLAAFLISWEALTSAHVVPKSVLPPFSDVLLRFLQSSTDLTFVARVGGTVGSLALGIGLAFCFALPLALLAGLKGGFDNTFTPLIIVVGSLPELALVPILLLWFGPNQLAVVAMASLAAFFPIFITLREGTREIPEEYFHVSKSFGSSNYETLAKVVMPALLPSMVTGLRLANEFVWEVVLGTEIIAHVTGLGTFIDTAVASGAMESAFAGIMVVGCLVLVVDQLVFGYLDTSVRRWHE